MKRERAQLGELFTYDRGVLRVTLFASIVIIFSMLLVGTIVDTIVEKQVVKKLKEQDLYTISEAVAGKVDARIERAIEMSVSLARSPVVVKWVADGEQNRELGGYAVDMLASIAKDYDYMNSFIVSAVTNHYWAENKQIISTVSTDNPDNAWFFDTLKAGKPVDVVIDDDVQRGNTSVFINVLIGETDKPLGVAGVGLSLVDLAKEFQAYKKGDSSRLWLINRSGTILLSDQVEDNWASIDQFIPADMAERVTNNRNGAQVLEYNNAGNELMDLISYPIHSSDLQIVYTIARTDTVSFLNTIKINTVIAIVVSLVVVVFLFYYISRKISNPYKHLLRMNEKLEHIVQERTKELAEQNVRISDSIDYALRIQRSLLPSDELLDELCAEHFAIWKPKDVVGGDFYWAKRTENGYLIAIGDCTGHGVPGAFMTMLAISALDQIADHGCQDDPGKMLLLLNRNVKETQKQEAPDHGLTDDGLDIGLCYVSDGRLVFAGARSALYVQRGTGSSLIKGDSKSIGYRRTPGDYRYVNHEVVIQGSETFYLTTDGFLDQDGGEKGYSFGRNRFMELLGECASLPLAEQKERFTDKLRQYMGQAEQRDDYMVLGFRTKPADM